MYPDNALGEFYPPWLIKQAEDEGHKSVAEIHAYCGPRMDYMGGGVDRGQEWLNSRLPR